MAAIPTAAVVLLAAVALSSRDAAPGERPPLSACACPWAWACPCPCPCLCRAGGGVALRLRLRGGRRPRLPPESHRRSRRAASPDESSPSEFPLVAHDDDSDDGSGDDEDEEQQPTTGGDDDEQAEESVSRWGPDSRRAAAGAGQEDEAFESMSDGEAAGRWSGDASEFVINLRRSASPRGSLIATRISRITPSGAHAPARGPSQPRGTGSAADAGDTLDADGGGGDGPPPWRLVFADSAENDEMASSLFRRRSVRRRGRVRRAGARQGAGVVSGRVAPASRQSSSARERTSFGAPHPSSLPPLPGADGAAASAVAATAEACGSSSSSLPPAASAAVVAVAAIMGGGAGGFGTDGGYVANVSAAAGSRTRHTTTHAGAVSAARAVRSRAMRLVCPSACPFGFLRARMHACMYTR